MLEVPSLRVYTLTHIYRFKGSNGLRHNWAVIHWGGFINWGSFSRGSSSLVQLSMMSFRLLRFIVFQAMLTLKTGNLITGLLMHGGVQFTGTDPAELM